MVWLDHIRKVGEQGYSLSTSDAQPFYDGDVDPIAFDSGAVSAWSDILTSALIEITPMLPETNLIMLHTIAREVYDHQQQQIYTKKQTDPSTSQHVTSEDDALFRMCGAEVARMMKFRKDEKKRKFEHVDKCHPKVQSIDQQMNLLQKICIPNGKRRTIKYSVPR